MYNFKSRLLSKYGIPHVFATRLGGVSTHPEFASLNVSSSRKNSDGDVDKISNIYENYKIILSTLAIPPENAVNATQIHSDIIFTPEENQMGKGVIPELGFLPPCDGVLLHPTPGKPRAACVKTADCVPILLANVKTKAICAVHAGWRGTVADIAGKAAKLLLTDNSGTSDIIAAIGPCIGKCCYEVSSDVKNAASEILSQSGSDTSDLFFAPISTNASSDTSPKFMADLSALNSELLKRRGIPHGNIDILGLCTCCHVHPETGKPDFFSHRASHGHSGTQLSVIVC